MDMIFYKDVTNKRVNIMPYMDKMGFKLKSESCNGMTDQEWNADRTKCHEENLTFEKKSIQSTDITPNKEKKIKIN